MFAVVRDAVGAHLPADIQLIENLVTGHFTCSLCAKTFTMSASGHRHIQSAHGSTKYKCEMCSKVVGRRDHFKSHLRRKHSIRYSVASAMVERSAFTDSAAISDFRR